MWQFSEAVRGLADGCLELGTPVTGGNVSFYNQTGEVAIHPTPVVGVLGVIEDVSRRTPMGFSNAGDAVLLLGETRDELDGSEWAHVVHGHLGGVPPQVDLAAERILAEFLVDVGRTGALTAAHDLSDGGVAQACVEMALRNGVGAKIAIPDSIDPFVFLFSESTARAIVTADPERVDMLLATATTLGVKMTRIGTVGGAGADLTFAGAEEISLPLDELSAASDATLPALFG
jgi:phosphoribosylformylglycinamidine synthase